MVREVPTPHIVLLGDSTLDNGAYTSGSPDVSGHLREMLGPSASVTLLARDGSTIDDLARQIDAIPAGATHLIVSAGGNDALLQGHLLFDDDFHGSVLDELWGAMTEFEQKYRKMQRKVAQADARTALCTIYNGDLNEPASHRARAALAVFNDVIIRIAFENRYPIIDLREVCVDRADYVNQIEPSATGGRKIAAAIARSLR